MKLTHRTALIVLFFALANLAVGYTIKRSFVDPALEELDHENGRKTVERIAEAIRREALHLDSLVIDYGSWDSTYEFAVSNDPRFIEENLTAEVHESTILDWLAVLDTTGKVISGPIYDLKKGGLIDIPEIRQEQWKPDHPLLSGDTRVKPIMGVMPTSEGPMLVASRDILSSTDEGQSRGRVVFGRRLDASLAKELGAQIDVDWNLWPVESELTPASVKGLLLRRDAESTVSIPAVNSKRHDVYTLFEDIGGVPSLIISANLPYEITGWSSYISQLCLLWVVIQGAVLVFLIMVPLNRAIIAPLGVLSRQLRVFRETSDLSIDLNTGTRGEVGELSREFGNMLHQIEDHVTERNRSEEALRRSEEHLRKAQQVAQVGSWQFDLESELWWWSDELFRIHGRALEEGAPTSSEIWQSLHPDERDRVARDFGELVNGEATTTGADVRVLTPDGETRNYRLLWNVERSQTGEAFRVFGTASDVTERHRAEEGLRRAAAVFDTATEAIVIADSHGIIVDVNEAFSNVTGYNHAEAVGREPDFLNSGRHHEGFFQGIADEVERLGRWEGEIWIRHKSGRAMPAWVSIGRTLDEGATTEQIVFVFNDMTERKNSEEVILRQANYDMLTEIPNRYLFMDRLRQEILRARRGGNNVALVFMDLDNFKNINDTLGHAAGDEVLRTVAQRIQQSLRDADTAARLGGDEFAVVLPDMENTMDAKSIAQRMLDSIAMPLVVHDKEVVTTASMGIALFPADSNDDQGLLREADIAMYRAKSGGGNAIEFFTPEMNERAVRRMQIESQLQRALDLDEFEVYYQPIVSLPNGQLMGVEALLRWNNSVLGSVSPAEFIPLAERSGIIETIGAWVLETACRQVKEWQDAEWPDLRVAVNLSPRELDRGDAVKMIARALDRSGLPAKSLEVEVTERVLLDDVERVTATFRQIKELGVGLCIDDFGTGYSSLSYLRNYPFDVLKIDRAFIHDATRHNSGVALLRAILAMAESLGLKVVAEGVETKAQMDLLCRLHCGFAQGYFFCPPMSAEKIGIGGPVVDLEGCPVSSWPDRDPAAEG